jgi:hypothetical protein
MPALTVLRRALACIFINTGVPGRVLERAIDEQTVFN